jgi:1-aminocyclopropane-1-carboxylate deaminase
VNIEQLKVPSVEAMPILPRLNSLRQPRAVDILHLENIHPVLSGNKWYKLKYNLIEAQKQGFDSLLSCGGPHSNHLHALACAGQVLGFKTTAFVRGYEHLPLTPTLIDCQRMGMSLTFVDKQAYKLRYDPQWCRQQAKQYASYWIAEGGDNELGHQGCEKLAEYCQGYDEVWLSIGSGCTFLGLADGLKKLASASMQTDNPKQPIIRGFLAIKGGDTLAARLLQEVGEGHRINTESHLGGFGKCPESLISLIQEYDQQGLYLDPVYTAKLVMAFEQKWQAGLLDESKRYLIIHTGGLQGRRGVSALSASAP